MTTQELGPKFEQLCTAVTLRPLQPKTQMHRSTSLQSGISSKKAVCSSRHLPEAERHETSRRVRKLL